ncbi:geranylgeranylglycerol-phosphate geranylgeranyltransferase [uncultured Polaribacter sp.]|uniref:geranylgeranylglycerol-phosphate geranylgeranyltransferase n=1 Tax=uncultured Polaribacter sp. TaxID=174711 RepID=UPI002611E9E3|nr:geranylgeranylglycerol-phosphate geranylgeranyltransferase [uncultured Polaribacter sp.]
MVLLTMVLTKYALIESGYFTHTGILSNIQFLYLILSILFITAGGYVINDIYDIETDKINRSKKIIIGKRISEKKAFKYYISLTFIGIAIGFLLSINSYIFLCFVIPVILLFLYSKYLKRTPFVGNLTISFLISFVICLAYYFHFFFLYSYDYSLFDKPLRNVIYVYISFSFLTTLIREIIKDIEDIDGDLKIKAKTLPIVIGRKRASKVAFFFTGLLFVFLLVVLQFLKNEPIFLSYGIGCILLPLSYFIYKLWFAKSKKDFSILSNLMKLIMLLGILSMLLFRFIN